MTQGGGQLFYIQNPHACQQVQMYSCWHGIISCHAHQTWTARSLHWYTAQAKFIPVFVPKVSISKENKQANLMLNIDTTSSIKSLVILGGEKQEKKKHFKETSLLLALNRMAWRDYPRMRECFFCC